MTGPIVPADQWPEGAVALVWNVEGHGRRLTCVRGEWALEADMTPTPTGWDWRVPAMRQPAIDLGQYAVAVQYAINGLLESGCMTDSVVAKKLRSLMALIDGQARLNEPFGTSEGLPAMIAAAPEPEA